VDFGWDDELEAFRTEVRTFARGMATPALIDELDKQGREGGRGPLMSQVIAEIDRRGWMRMCWPKEYGGEARSPWYQYILVEELQAHGVAYSLGTAGMIGPAVMQFGTPEQKQKYLPGLWSGEIRCALGYSEPSAGTDLASLRTRAVRDGEEWVINGQKLWTSGAHVSTHVWLAVRTNPDVEKHRGISMFIVPLDSPGVTIRPVWTFADWRTNEVFFDDVRVPNEALIGEANTGWYIAARALDYERVSIGGYTGLVMSFERLVRHLREQRPELLKEPEVRVRLAELEVELHSVRALTLTNAAIIAAGDTPTMQASMVKVASSELRYHLGSVAMDLLGRHGALTRESGDLAPEDGDFDRTYRSSPILRFGGGTNEVQRNIIAQRGLKLPR
jgi:alkylation response protein AidB-like acyl-CoA dehydrogenase